ncbi:MAG TPA: hypothetical protein VGS22_19280 [Thermoanaerobaculia bacterium]|jgi:hypothetical protein|nr:hypothetical protein [Thermoanaerobaculia bacterium]
MKDRKEGFSLGKAGADPSKRARRRFLMFNEEVPGTTVQASALSEPKLPPWVGE